MATTFKPPRCVHILLDHSYAGDAGRYVTTRVHTFSDQGTGLNMSVPIGFRTDFASFPRFLWWLLEREGPWARAALFHDWCYRQQLVGRFAADAIFRVILEADGVPKRWQLAFFAALRLYGRRAWRANRAKLRASQGWSLPDADLQLVRAEAAA